MSEGLGPCFVVTYLRGMPQNLKLLFLLMLLSAGLQAQYFLNGSAVQTNDSCFQLTSEVTFDVGSIWFPETGLAFLGRLLIAVSQVKLCGHYRCCDAAAMQALVKP